MGNFEDEIRKKLQEGNINYDPSNWEEISQNLSSNPPHTPFESEINEKLNEGSFNTPENAWDQFNDKFNSRSNFEEKIKEKLNNEKVDFDYKNWEKIAEKLDYQKLNSFERAIKSTLSNVNINYNPVHWAALEKSLIRTSRIKYIWRGAAAILIIIATGLGINSLADQKNKNNSETQNNVNSSLLSQSEESIEDLDNNLINEIYNGMYDDHISTNQINNGFKSLSFKEKEVPISYMIDSNSINKKNIYYPEEENNNNISTINNGANESNNFFIKIDNFPLQEYCSTIELLLNKIPTNKKSNLEYQIHPGATIWLNFWENSSITGLYAKNYSSLFYSTDWEIVDVNRNQIGELNFVQPLTYIAAFEKRINKHISLGGFYEYELMKNWNNRSGNISISYSKNILNKFDFKIGLSTTFNSNNLAVNRLTLRERSLNSDYIFSTDLGDIKSKKEQNATLDLGLFVNNRRFYLGYNHNNLASYCFEKEDDVRLNKHTLITGIHAPEFKKIKSTLLFKYERELFNSYSPAIGVTYDNRFFTALEYEDFLNKKITIGYQNNRKIKFQLTYSRKNLTSFQKENLNIDNFTEIQGNVSGGVNYTF